MISYLNLYGGDLERVHAEALEHLSMDQLRAAVAWYHDHVRAGIPKEHIVLAFHHPSRRPDTEFAVT